MVDAGRRAGRVSALTGTGVSMGKHANITEWMLWALHIVTGSYDRPGGMWFNPGYLLQLDTREWTASDGLPGPGPASRPLLPRRFDEYPCAGVVPEIEAGNLRVLRFEHGAEQICMWRVTRRMNFADRSWERVEFWGSRMTRQPIEQEPVGWRHLELGEAGRVA